MVFFFLSQVPRSQGADSELCLGTKLAGTVFPGTEQRRAVHRKALIHAHRPLEAAIYSGAQQMGRHQVIKMPSLVVCCFSCSIFRPRALEAQGKEGPRAGKWGAPTKLQAHHTVYSDRINRGKKKLQDATYGCEFAFAFHFHCSTPRRAEH